MNRTVAVKVIDRAIVKNAQAVERFRREVQSAAQLDHPNIVTAHDAEKAGDTHLLVMEYVQGDNLSDVVKRDGALRVDLGMRLHSTSGPRITARARERHGSS